jgi:2,3-dihydroxybenzoate decarboxylase
MPSEYFREHFAITTSGVTFAPALKLCLEVLGVDRIIFAADYPYESVAEAVNFIDPADIGDDARRAILAGNAERHFGLAAATAAAR